MVTKQTIENINETFVTGLRGILKISRFWKEIWRFKITYFSIASALLLPLIAFLGKLDSTSLICDIVNLMISFLPCILGFTIAGYALIIGFVQSNMLNSISEPAKDSKFSLYQIMSAKFALNIILQSIALLIAFIIHFINYFDVNNKLDIIWSDKFITFVNLIGLSILFFWFSISLLLVIQIVINIFGFSQLHHYFINKAKISSKQKPKE